MTNQEGLTVSDTIIFGLNFGPQMKQARTKFWKAIEKSHFHFER